jgi:hypothetical protein
VVVSNLETATDFVLISDLQVTQNENVSICTHIFTHILQSTLAVMVDFLRFRAIIVGMTRIMRKELVVKFSASYFSVSCECVSGECTRSHFQISSQKKVSYMQ